MRDGTIYTLSEYIEKNEYEERASHSLGEKMAKATDNPRWMLIAGGIAGAAIFLVIVYLRLDAERKRFDPRLRPIQSIDAPGGPLIGGPFDLIDVNRKRVTSEDLKGKWMYIYFGFANCPDICPQEMAKMTKVTRELDKRIGPDYWQPLFISIDAARDTPEKLKEYLQDFHHRILGLTGTEGEVEQVARSYRVYFAVPDDPAMNQQDYLIDHSIIMYLMDPSGKFCDYTTKEFTWFESYNKLLKRMMDYEKKQQENGLLFNEKVTKLMSFSGTEDELSSIATAKLQKKQR